MKNLYIAVNNYCFTQGINSVVDQFMNNRNEFKKEGIVVKGVIDSRAFFEDIPTRQTIEETHANIKKSRIYRSFFGNITAVYLHSIRVGESVAKQVERIVDDNDIILFQDPYAAYFFIKRKRKNVTIYYMSHAYEDELEQLFINYPYLKNTRIEEKLRYIYSEVYTKSKTIVICKKAEAWVKKFNPKAEVGVLYNTVKTGNMICKNVGKHSKLNLVMASSINERKGFDLLIQALKGLSKDYMSKIELHIYGDGPYLDVFQKECRKENYKNIHIYGRVNNPYQNYSDIDVYFMTSKSETLPMGILEAMSCGLPIISTNVGAIDELVIDEYNGKLFMPTLDGITESLKYVIDNYNRLNTFGANSKSRFEAVFSNKHWTVCFSNILRNNNDI